jgi:CRP-like cAMP-binding protein
MTENACLLGSDDAADALRPSLHALKEVSLFSILPDEDIFCFCDAARVHTYKKGKILYIEEEKANFFYVINAGWIKLFHTLPEGDEVTVDMLTAGHMVGESAIFENGFHTSSAQVIEDVQLLSLPTKILKEQIEKNPRLALSMVSSMFRHHRRHYDAIALNAIQSAPQRIACFLLRLCPRSGKEAIVFDLPYDKTLIAGTLGMDGATFSRALNVLRQKTTLRISGSRVEIDKIDSLIKYVYGALSSQNTRRRKGD